MCVQLRVFQVRKVVDFREIVLRQISSVPVLPVLLLVGAAVENVAVCYLSALLPTCLPTLHAYALGEAGLSRDLIIIHLLNTLEHRMRTVVGIVTWWQAFGVH